MTTSSVEINIIAPTALIRHLELSKSVCFTGYRPGKFAKSDHRPGEQIVKDRLLKAIAEQYSLGKRFFLSGMAEGFDLWAAEAVLQCKANGLCPAIHLFAVVPYKGQNSNYREPYSEMYDRVLRGADQVVVLSENYFPECFHRRNDYLLSHSSSVICFYDGQRGGTHYTVNRAKKQGLSILNLAAESNEATLF